MYITDETQMKVVLIFIEDPEKKKALELTEPEISGSGEMRADTLPIIAAHSCNKP
jgi:hypothetical protein